MHFLTIVSAIYQRGHGNIVWLFVKLSTFNAAVLARHVVIFVGNVIWLLSSFVSFNTLSRVVVSACFVYIKWDCQCFFYAPRPCLVVAPNNAP